MLCDGNHPANDKCIIYKDIGKRNSLSQNEHRNSSTVEYQYAQTTNKNPHELQKT